MFLKISLLIALVLYVRGFQQLEEFRYDITTVNAYLIKQGFRVVNQWLSEFTTQIGYSE